MVELNLYVAVMLSDLYAFFPHRLVFGKTVQLTDKPSGVVVEGVIAFLEFVQLLENCDWNDQVVVLKFPDTSVIVKDDIGVKDKNLFFSFHGNS